MKSSISSGSRVSRKLVAIQVHDHRLCRLPPNLQQQLTDHDVVAVHVVLAFPRYVHSSLKDHLAELKAVASERSTSAGAVHLPDPSDGKQEAIAMADAYPYLT
jgi:hypothetical protein